MRLIFLDIDGVLNGHDQHRHPNGYCGISPGCVYHLNRIVRETGAELVISSAWRYLLNNAMSLDGFRYMLMTYGLDKDVHIQGRTARDEDIPDRGAQIHAYLAGALKLGRIDEYVVLDDGNEEAPHPPATMPLSESLRRQCGDRWVQTNGKVGLTEADADRAVAILKGEPIPEPSKAREVAGMLHRRFFPQCYPPAGDGSHAPR